MTLAPFPAIEQFAEYQVAPTLYETLRSVCRTLQPQSYLEVGTREGCSLLTVVRSSPRLVRIVCCDTWTWGATGEGSNRGSHAHIDDLLARVRYIGDITYLDGDSTVLLPELHGQFDLVLIDADHSDLNARLDMQEGWRLLRPGGILVADDIRNEKYTLLPVFESVVRESHAIRLDNSVDGIGIMQKPMVRSAR